MKRLLLLLALVQPAIMAAQGDHLDPFTFCGFDDYHNRDYSEHFVDVYIGGVKDSDLSWWGFNYAYMGEKYGPYFSVGTDFAGSSSIFGGGVIRLTDPDIDPCDFQVYAGVGRVGVRSSLNLGARIAWRSITKVSGLDIGCGLQLYKGGFTPTITIGLYLWGIPTLVGLSLIGAVVMST